MSFKIDLDRFSNPYYSVNFPDFPGLVNLSQARENGDIAGFLDPLITVSKRRTTPFSSDLTSRDDVILAIFSLFLLLIIDGIVASVLLRTKGGNISNFGFSIKVVLEYCREFRFIRVFRKPTPRTHTRTSRLNLKLLIVAISLLVFIIGLEVGILFLTEPELKQITNRDVTFRLVQPVIPTWDDVRFHTRASFNRPCSATSFQGVVQGDTRLNGCVSSNISPIDFNVFQPVQDEAHIIIESRLHEYGADHIVDVNGDIANFTARGYFTLFDGKSRMMPRDLESKQENLHMRAIHLQYLAYLFSWYNTTVKEDRTMTLERLNSLQPEYEQLADRTILIFKIGSQSIERQAKVYKTTARGRVPRGVQALRLGQHFFRGMTALAVVEGNETDLFTERGIQTERSVVWQEISRPMNWLSLIITVISAMCLLLVLRIRLKPVAIADIAGAWVKRTVGAKGVRSPVEIDDNEHKHFCVVPSRHREEYEDVSTEPRVSTGE